MERVLKQYSSFDFFDKINKAYVRRVICLFLTRFLELLTMLFTLSLKASGLDLKPISHTLYMQCICMMYMHANIHHFNLSTYSLKISMLG